MVRRPTRVAWACGVLVAAASCGGDPEPGAPASADGAVAGAWFEEVALASGVDFVHGFGPLRHWMPEVTGSGVALFDMDGDGDLDLFALQGCDLDPSEGAPAFDSRNRLFRNEGDGTFVDVTDAAGVGHRGFGVGCAVGDHDGDGRLDLYVTNVGPNVLYRNLGGGRFEDVTGTAGVAGDGWGTSATFLDIDVDGDLDLFVANYIDWRSEDEVPCFTARGERTYCNPNRFRRSGQDQLFENQGDGTFLDVTAARGLDATTGNGLGVVWGQLDERPGIDIYVANDGNPNQLWSMGPDGVMTDRAMRLGCALSGDGVAEAGMGVCLEDMNGDGRWDLMVTHLAGETNTAYFGRGGGFRDRTRRTGTVRASRPSTGFGIGLADFDHDGLLDMYVANGRVILQAAILDAERPLAEPDHLLRGAADGRFVQVPDAEVQAPPVLTVGRGAAFGDLDGDGGVDICVNDMGGRLRILRNVAPKRGGAATWSVLERDGLPAVGAVLTYALGEGTVKRQIQRTSSFCSSNDPRLHVGFGAQAVIEEVEVTWLDGAVETFGPFEPGRAATLRRGRGEAAPR